MDTPAAADWSELPADVLGLVLLNLEFPDLFRSAAVCKLWRATARDMRRLGLYSHAQTPCLLYTTAAAGPRAAVLYSLADKTTSYTVPLPDPPIAERHIVGSSHGWLVTADHRSELHLLNPATGEQLDLPPVATIEHVRPLYDDTGNLNNYKLVYYDGGGNSHRSNDDDMHTVTHPPETFREFLYLKAVISSDPSRGDDYTVMLIHHPYLQLSFARSGDKKWTWIKMGNNECEWFEDCIYHDGVFYAQTVHGAIHAIDVVSASSSFTHRLILKPTMGELGTLYIVRTTEGDILQVLRVTEEDEDSEHKEVRTTGIGVFKVDYKKQDLDEVDDIGNNALFIGTSYSICLPVKDYPHLMPNHVYFDDDYGYLVHRKHLRRDVGVYDYTNDTAIDVWNPQPWLNWPLAPVWITPSFTKTAKYS
uniref:F-box domain-containing protein n=1 Tax=Oryza glumipatula TaxID=40148 RepID=A0A0E0BP21_9ORYZ